jgi:hypothetical protein
VFEAPSALAYCRTTTCEPRKENCGNLGGCPTKGRPLFWAGRCISFSVQRDASPLRGVDLEVAEDVIGAGFRAWTEASCGSGVRPSIALQKTAPVTCNAVEYNRSGGNTNVWIFRDSGWPHSDIGGAVALATLTYDVDTGEIYDADVELNSAENLLTVGDTGIRADLLSVVTHEAGHVLGLAHAPSTDATMYPAYTPGETGLRTLSPDDVAGVCAVYPPSRTGSTSCEPRGGFAGDCDPDGGAADAGTTPPAREPGGDDSGCSVAPSNAASSHAGAALCICLALAAFCRRRAGYSAVSG